MAGSVTIPRGGREYVTADVAGVPDDAPLEVTVDRATWLAAERLPGKLRFLAAAPDVTGNPANTVVVPLGRSAVHARLADNPEIVIRDVGYIDLK
ncbi:hypothetical protein [Actinotalea sp. Marseille-Q4924]|uniref:hypothetical protein n=1 Tax=Actinotalea sp. Marseille-Q4924 TaxID=2866571 RepID=UPI001CE4779C|nr:hypothetical protein [Actinotalea sp. Marseille-Q4924]